MLEGLKVIEMSTYVAAPGAGGMLRDWGAEVIKVEPLSGCPMRSFFEGTKSKLEIVGNPIFSLDNRGKKGMTINTSNKKGADIVRELIKDADIFLTNVRPTSLENSKLDHETLLGINPKLIYCSLSGYGLDGEERDRPGFDIAAFWSRSGMAHLTREKEKNLYLLELLLEITSPQYLQLAEYWLQFMKDKKRVKAKLLKAHS